MARYIECPSCKNKAVDRQFRLVMLVSVEAPSERYSKQEILYARICPKCNVVFYDREYDEKLRV